MLAVIKGYAPNLISFMKPGVLLCLRGHTNRRPVLASTFRFLKTEGWLELRVNSTSAFGMARKCKFLRSSWTMQNISEPDHSWDSIPYNFATYMRASPLQSANCAM